MDHNEMLQNFQWNDDAGDDDKPSISFLADDIKEAVMSIRTYMLESNIGSVDLSRITEETPIVPVTIPSSVHKCVANIFDRQYNFSSREDLCAALIDEWYKNMDEEFKVKISQKISSVLNAKVEDVCLLNDDVEVDVNVSMTVGNEDTNVSASSKHKQESCLTAEIVLSTEETGRLADLVV